MSNRLATEQSPYLLQHADNPVDWFPWSDDAFQKAKEEDKPVFLSIGYATCHWCHVMAHESFEDREVADLMNDAFVNIKVDREERPDIDNTYMTVCQLLTGQGGWPLTIVMTPDKKPFFAATYIPKNTRFNRIGMTDLVPRLQKAWEENRNELLRSAHKITSGFQKTLQHQPGESPGREQIQKAYESLKQRYDPSSGGFGESPKFPSPHNLTFLLQYDSSYKSGTGKKMTDHTLEQMRLGGIYDHIGLGFHRYSTDRQWLLPHFEKMLYDQALLMIAYTEGWKRSGDSLFQTTVFQIAEYISEQLTSPEGGFFSAEDADSEGEEGKFYVWTLNEIQEILDHGDDSLLTDIYNIRPEGNFRDESTGEKTGKNIPYFEARPDLLAVEKEIEPDELEKFIDRTRKILKRKRDQRVRPLLDDKILTDWNGLMIAALARAGATFEDKNLIEIAERSAQFVQNKLSDDTGDLLHRYRNGEAAIPAMADDYAFFIWGLIELYEATFKTKYLKQATELNNRFVKHCWDEQSGGFYFTGKKSEELLGRKKEIYDGAMPSSNSTAVMNLLRLSRLTGDATLEDKANRTFQTFSEFLQKAPEASTFAMQALIRATEASAEIVICGDPEDKEVQSMIRTIRLKMKEPYVIHLKTKNNQEGLSELAPYTENFSIDKTPAVYLCRSFTCEAPVYSVEEVERLIGSENRN